MVRVRCVDENRDEPEELVVRVGQNRCPFQQDRLQVQAKPKVHNALDMGVRTATVD